jgi:hypothetical protein
MRHAIFFLASRKGPPDDPQTGEIIDSIIFTDKFGSYVENSFFGWLIAKPDAASAAYGFCIHAGFNLLDYDGPYLAPGFRLFNRKPKWASLLPPGTIDPEKWARRQKYY